MTELMTSSRYRAAHLCARYQHYRYDLGYRPRERTPRTLAFSLLVHASLEQWWLAWKAEAGLRDRVPLRQAIDVIEANQFETLDDFDLAKAEALITGYHCRWLPEMRGVEVLAVEPEFRSPLSDPDTDEESAAWQLAGKIDVIIRKDGHIYLIEHKTTSVDLSPGLAYWSKLRMDPQISIRHDGARSLGYEVRGYIYDVITKPALRPLKATPVKNRKYTNAGKLYASQRERDETPTEYCDRLISTINDALDKYFQRAIVVRRDRELDEARRDIWATVQSIVARSTLAARNIDACFHYHRPCDYLDVCSGVDHITNEGRFIRLTNKHPELEGEIYESPNCND